jgi:galactose mutarotase-like enzyme
VPQPGYRFQFDLTVTYELDSIGLAWQLDAVNSPRAASTEGAHV